LFLLPAPLLLRDFFLFLLPASLESDDELDEPLDEDPLDDDPLELSESLELEDEDTTGFFRFLLDTNGFFFFFLGAEET
jgi:hypothetical protein